MNTLKKTLYTQRIFNCEDVRFLINLGIIREIELLGKRYVLKKLSQLMFKKKTKRKTHHIGCMFIQKTQKLGLGIVLLDIEFQIILKLNYKRNYQMVWN